MKLYREEQVRDILKLARLNSQVYTDDYLIKSLTPIELPTDEEIVAKSKQEPYNSDIELASRIGYVAGAKWMKSKIQGGK